MHSTTQLILPSDHHLERFARAVDGNDDDIFSGLQAEFLDGFDGAERHVVVVREQHIDVAAAFLQKPAHDFRSLVHREIGRRRNQAIVNVVALPDDVAGILCRARWTARSLPCPEAPR